MAVELLQSVVISESPADTFATFIPDIKKLNSPSLQLNHLLSTFRETHRLKDEYTYFSDENGLYWLTDELQKIYIQDITNRPTTVRSKEGFVLDQLEMWAKYASEGVSIWFSPDKKQSGGYPCSKIIFHKISYEVSNRFTKPQKSVAICSINIDATPEIIAQKLLTIFNRDDVTSLERLREILLVPSDEQLIEIINLIQSENSNLLTPKLEIADKQVIPVRDQINFGVDPRQIVFEASRRGVLGNHSISCAENEVRSSNTLIESKNAMVLEGTWAKNCGVCGAVIEAYITAGYVCKNCGEKYLGVC